MTIHSCAHMSTSGSARARRTLESRRRLSRRCVLLGTGVWAVKACWGKATNKLCRKRSAGFAVESEGLQGRIRPPPQAFFFGRKIEKGEGAATTGRQPA
jgi:hypothetical protein